MARSIGILGSTGSIGTQTLSVIRELNSLPESSSNPHYSVKLLACGNNRELISEQIAEFAPEAVCVAGEETARWLQEKYRVLEVFHGSSGLTRCASERMDLLVTAISGMRGLLPTLAAIDAGTDIALANKETLVAAGELVMKRAKDKKVKIIPVDSEHSAIFQCLKGAMRGGKRSVRRLILTASGGPFRTFSEEELNNVTADQALNHPTWKMGGKITIDCATMMNKGLEVIEAMHLFGMGPDRIDVAVHPQSIVHSMVEFTDGSVMAQLGVPDMKTPIELALTYPYRGNTARPGLDITQLGSLTFEKPRTEVFRCLKLAYDAAHAGGTMPAALNGANEEAVALFLKGKISFAGISELVEGAMTAHASAQLSCGEFDRAPGLDAVLAADRGARDYVRRSMNCP
ncbi:MAG: 1-deoxy-D-xylulose-5-phosphate reductoisomerase [Clostridia bacterium]|nr:1-deoxy-D-xylulose-5-phosphate reductoisomerase [Clostridia bacterium]